MYKSPKTTVLFSFKIRTTNGAKMYYFHSFLFWQLKSTHKNLTNRLLRARIHQRIFSLKKTLRLMPLILEQEEVEFFTKTIKQELIIHKWTLALNPHVKKSIFNYKAT